jgi:hypothetical protein
MPDIAPATLFPQISHAKKRGFLAAFTTCGQVTKAAAAIGVDHSHHYYWLKTDQAYAAAFADAKAIQAASLEDEAIRRARDGVTRTVYHQGVAVGEELHYSDTLLIFLLKGMMPEKYRESRHERESTATISDLLKAVLLDMVQRQQGKDMTPATDWAPLSAPADPATAPALPAPPTPERPVVKGR